ncbi:ribosomal protein L5 [Suillus hirtellus]|nr:ribosomal protein L5 [Suillus hirtellus]
MSLTAACVSHSAQAVRPFRKPPKIHKILKCDKNCLPVPHIRNLIVHDTHPCRLMDHYHTALQDNLMYMTYNHESGTPSSPRQIRLTYDPNDPYTKNHYNPPVSGSKAAQKLAPPTTSQNIVHLEKIVIHSMMKEALTNQSNLLGLIAAFHAMSGETESGRGRPLSSGVQIVKGKKNVGGWMCPGIPIGAKVELKGPKMYDFLNTLVEFVLPRIREFPGIVMPSTSSTMKSPSGMAGVNLDSYPKPYGMHIHFVTNAVGLGAQNRARALVSGFQIPFARK